MDSILEALNQSYLSAKNRGDEGQAEELRKAMEARKRVLEAELSA